MVGSSDSQRVAATQQRLFWEKEKSASAKTQQGDRVHLPCGRRRDLFSAREHSFRSFSFILASIVFVDLKSLNFSSIFCFSIFFFIFLFIFGAIKVALFFCGFPILSMLLFVITLRF